MVCMEDIALLGDGRFSVMEPRPIYTPSSCPHITRFLPNISLLSNFKLVLFFDLTAANNHTYYQ